MKEKPVHAPTGEMTPLYERIRQILESARMTAARSVNTAQVMANWMIGREIVEEEQKGRKRADYGHRLLEQLSAKLRTEFGKGYSVNNLEHFRDFFLTFPEFLFTEIPHAARGESITSHPQTSDGISHAPRGELGELLSLAALDRAFTQKGTTWQPGRFHPNLSWTHYRILLRVEKSEARAFYEIEAIRNNWTTRELERQINSLLYERLALSTDRKGLMRLATRGQEVSSTVCLPCITAGCP